MRFLTYNIRHAEGYDGWVSPARIGRVLRDARPDVVGLNEVWRLRNFHDQAGHVADTMGFSAVFHSTKSYPWLEQGNAVLTRGTVVDVSELVLPRGIERRGALLCDIELEGQRFAFVSTHLSLGRATRAAQIQALVELLPRDRPLVIAGDFNCTAEELEPLRSFLTVHREPPYTYPAIRPKRGLDHIAFSEHWTFEGMGIVRSLASDHLAVWADLHLS